MKNSGYEGRQDGIRTWVTPTIDTFDNLYRDREYEITMSIPEFTCVCPKTGLPDFATLTLTYYPDQKCIELKSFKEYTLAFRNQGIFHENVVNKMVDDIVASIKPRKLKLVGVFNARGGIKTTVTRNYPNT